MATAYATAPRSTRGMTAEEKKVIFASSLGTVFEWYDFYIYGTLAAILAKQFFSGVAPTAAFIFTLLAFAAIFAGLGLVSTGDYASAAWIVLGVFLGSAAWWTILAAAAGRLRGRLGPRLARGINLASGISILGFALWQVVELFR